MQTCGASHSCFSGGAGPSLRAGGERIMGKSEKGVVIWNQTPLLTGHFSF